MPGGFLGVAVQDADPQLPAVGASPELTAEGGRRILLVSALADRWGVETTPAGGKAVWFQLDVVRPTARR